MPKPPGDQAPDDKPLVPDYSIETKHLRGGAVTEAKIDPGVLARTGAWMLGLAETAEDGQPGPPGAGGSGGGGAGPPGSPGAAGADGKPGMPGQDADDAPEHYTLLPHGVDRDEAFRARGDLMMGTGPGSAQRHPVGSDNQILGASSFVQTGVQWMNVADLLSTASGTRSWFVAPSSGNIDDSTFSKTGATPDFADIWNFGEALGRSGVYLNTMVPIDWLSGIVTVYMWWHTNTVTGNMRWLLSLGEFAAGEDPTLVSDKLAAFGTTAADGLNTMRTSLGTFTPDAAGDMLKINLERDAANVLDTATGGGRVMGLEFVYTARTVIAASGQAPVIGNQAPGSFTIADEKFAVQGKRLKLTGSQRLTIQGSGRLSLIN